MLEEERMGYWVRRRPLLSTLASFPGLRGGGGGGEKAWYALFAHARNYCVREQWACILDSKISIYTVVQRSSSERKEKQHSVV